MAAEDDARFQRMHTDPRFKKMVRSKLKLPVDARFRHMLTDKAFVDPFGIDKRGKPAARKKAKKQHTMQRYYTFEEDEGGQKAEAGKMDKDAPQSKEEESDEEHDQDDENVASSSESSSESSDSDESSASSDAEEEEERKVATTETETPRLAVVNMDWSCIKAVDLLVLFNSFLPKGGSVKSVAVYPSQFGLEQMKMEEVKGPSLFQSKSDESDDDEGGVNMEKLRAYEKSKLRYYFAVVTCDSASTASVLYTSCDGMEFERTSNVLDLQFIPDDMQFNVEARDIATEVVAGYEAPDYQTRALQLSNVKLTWDDDEPVRVKHLRRRFNADELAEMDLKAYIASDDDEDDEAGADESRKNKLRSLLLETAPEAGSKGKKSDVDMEVTFSSGLDELSKKYLEKNQKENETVWEARLRKQREKKAEKKKGNKESENNEDDENGFDDPFFETNHETLNSDSEHEEAKPKRKMNKVEDSKKTAAENKKERELKRKEEGRSKAELELLLLNEQGEKKIKRDKKESESSMNEKLSEDPRFSALFNSHHFAVDPTDPRFKRSAAKLRVIAEMQQKRFAGDDGEGGNGGSNEKSKLELNSMVKSLKRKARK